MTTFATRYPAVGTWTRSQERVCDFLLAQGVAGQQIARVIGRGHRSVQRRQRIALRHLQGGVPLTTTPAGLTRTERALVECFVAAEGRLVLRETLIRAIGGDPAFPPDHRVVDVHLHNIRGKGFVFRTLRATGYYLVRYQEPGTLP